MAQAAGGGGITVNLPTVDWSQLVPQLVGYFFDGIGTWLTKAEHGTFDSLWSNDRNVLGQTPLAMTWALGPVQGQLGDIQNAARAVLVFAVILLGLRGMLSGVVTSRGYDMLSEAVGGILPAVILVAAFPLLIPVVIGLVNSAASAVAGSASVSTFIGAGGGFSDPLVSAILLLILLFFGLRLLIKSIWRVGFLAVLLPVGFVACMLYAVPQSRWVLTWWARMWGGMLIAQIPSVFALSIGAGLFAGGAGIGAFVYSIAFLQLATDLYSIIPFGHSGNSGGAPWGTLPGRLGMMAVGNMGAAAAAVASIPANQLTTRADQYGYQ